MTMKKLAYFLEINEEAEARLEKIAQQIPCFVNRNGEEVEILCREEDAKFVEYFLAPII